VAQRGLIRIQIWLEIAAIENVPIAFVCSTITDDFYPRRRLSFRRSLDIFAVRLVLVM